MRTENTKKTPGAALLGAFAPCPVIHTFALAAALVIALHLLLRCDHDLMAPLSESFVRPVHAALARLNSHVPFSVAEALIAVAAAAVLARLLVGLVRLILRRSSARRAYRLFAGLLAFVLWVYAGFCVLWGTYYYGDDFSAKSGLESGPVSVSQLETVTEYFAALANEYGAAVPRDESGLYTCDRSAVLARSASLFDGMADALPCLDGPRVAAKPVRFSRVMSYLDFTGFFFPFTGEANVNTDFPPALFASTVAHELSHQRGVAKEHEANFVAVLASLRSGDADYCYSAALLAYTHLGNALYRVDPDAWQQIRDSLPDEIVLDLRYNSAYWAQYKGLTATVTQSLNDKMIKSYGDELGTQSYGAVVDLLVNYYA